MIKVIKIYLSVESLFMFHVLASLAFLHDDLEFLKSTLVNTSMTKLVAIECKLPLLWKAQMQLVSWKWIWYTKGSEE